MPGFDPQDTAVNSAPAGGGDFWAKDAVVKGPSSGSPWSSSDTPVKAQPSAVSNYLSTSAEELGRIPKELPGMVGEAVSRRYHQAREMMKSGAQEMKSGVVGLQPGEAIGGLTKDVAGGLNVLLSPVYAAGLDIAPQFIDPGVLPEEGSFASKVAEHESGGRTLAHAPTGSAGGLYQFVRSTWNSIRREHPELNLTTDGRFDPAQSTRAFNALTADNARQLQLAGITPTEKNLYMEHFLGADGAEKFIKETVDDPNANAAELFPKEAAANRNIFFNHDGSSRTLQEVYDLQTAKFGPNTPKLAKEGVPAAAEARPGESTLSAARAPVQYPTFEAPTKQFLAEQSDSLYRLQQGQRMDREELLQYADRLPPELKDADLQKKFYQAMENPDLIKTFSPEERAAFQQYMVPLKTEEQALANAATNAGFKNEGYVHRMIRGKSSQFDPILGETGRGDPIGGTGVMRRTTSSLQDRKYFAIENPQGERRVVHFHDGKVIDTKSDFEVPNARLSTTSPVDELRPGAELESDEGPWKVVQARTPEIESVTPNRYYQNALAVTVDNVARLRSVVRAIQETQRIRSLPEFDQYTFPAQSLSLDWHGPKPPSDWRVPKMPLFRDRVMEPHWADVLDDIYKNYPKNGALKTLAAINRFSVMSLYWSPIVHMKNVTADWAVARGWDWFKPNAYWSVAMDGARAVHEVVTRGPKYRDLAREGSALQYSAVRNDEFYETLLRHAGEDVQKNPQRWSPIIRALGLSGPADMMHVLWRGSSKVLWAYSDVLMMQRVLELERKGMPVRQAIKNAEKTIHNYRIPSQVMGQRLIAQALKNPMIVEFSPYHYGSWKAYASMARDLAKGSPEERVDAMGRILVLGMLTTLAYPLLNYAVQEATGNKAAKSSAPGLTAIPQDLIDLYNGNRDLISSISNIFTIAPLLKTGTETLVNRSFFSGRPIAEPADIRHGDVGHVLSQEAEHAASNLIEPYQMIDQMAHAGKDLPTAIRDQILGIQEPTPQQLAARQKALHYQDIEARSRHRKPVGLLEQGYNYLAGLL